MYNCKKVLGMVLAGAVCAGGAAWADESKFNDFTQPVFGSSDSDGYVDPQFAMRKDCLSHPSRPGWAMVHTHYYKWRLELALAYKTRRTGRLITEAEHCTCDMLFPDWAELRPEIEALWASVSDLPRNEWSKEMRANFKAIYYPIRNEATRYSFDVGRLCRNPV